MLCPMWLGAESPEERTHTHSEAGIGWGSPTTVTQNLGVFIRYSTVGGFLGLSRRCLRQPVSDCKQLGGGSLFVHIGQSFVNTHTSKDSFAIPFSLFNRFANLPWANWSWSWQTLHIQKFIHSGLPPLFPPDLSCLWVDMNVWGWFIPSVHLSSLTSFEMAQEITN